GWHVIVDARGAQKHDGFGPADGAKFPADGTVPAGGGPAGRADGWAGHCKRSGHAGGAGSGTEERGPAAGTVAAGTANSPPARSAGAAAGYSGPGTRGM